MSNEIWYLALVPLALYAEIMIILAPHWDRKAPGDEGTWYLALIADPLTSPPHPPHTQK